MVNLATKLRTFFTLCMDTCCCRGRRRRSRKDNRQLDTKQPIRKLETTLLTTKTLLPQSKIKVIKFDETSTKSDSEDKSKSYSLKTLTDTETESTTEDSVPTTLKEPLITRVTLSNDEIILRLSGKEKSVIQSRIPSEELTLKQLITLLKLSETSKSKQGIFPSLSEVKKFIKDREAIKQQPPKVSIIYDSVIPEPSIFKKIKLLDNGRKEELDRKIPITKKSPIRIPKKFSNILPNKIIDQRTETKVAQAILLPKKKETIITQPDVSECKIILMDKLVQNESPTELLIRSPREPVKDLKFDSESKMTFICKSLGKMLDKSSKGISKDNNDNKEQNLQLIKSKLMEKQKIMEKIEAKMDRKIKSIRKSINTFVTSLTTTDKEQLVVVKFNDKIIKEQKYPIDRIITVKLVPPGQLKSIIKSSFSLKRRRKSKSGSKKTIKSKKIRSLSRISLKNNDDNSIRKRNLSLNNDYRKKRFKSLYRRKRLDKRKKSKNGSIRSVDSADSEYSYKSIDSGHLTNKSIRIKSGKDQSFKSYKSNSLNRRIKKSQPFRFGTERDLIEYMKRMEDNRKIIQEKFRKNQYENSLNKSIN